MARTDTLGHFLTDVCDSIRSRLGTSNPIRADYIDSVITNMSPGIDKAIILNRTSTGTYGLLAKFSVEEQVSMNQWRIYLEEITLYRSGTSGDLSETVTISLDNTDSSGTKIQDYGSSQLTLEIFDGDDRQTRVFSPAQRIYFDIPGIKNSDYNDYMALRATGTNINTSTAVEYISLLGRTPKATTVVFGKPSGSPSQWFTAELKFTPDLDHNGYKVEWFHPTFWRTTTTGSQSINGNYGLFIMTSSGGLCPWSLNGISNSIPDGTDHLDLQEQFESWGLTWSQVQYCSFSTYISLTGGVHGDFAVGMYASSGHIQEPQSETKTLDINPD